MICFLAIQCVIQLHTGFLHLDMTQQPSRSSQSAPPHIVISLSAPSVEVAQHPPQAVEEAAVDNNNSTLEYFIKADEFPEVAANHVVLVDAATQWSRPSSQPASAAASPNPLLGIRVSGILEAVITAVQPVFEAPRRPPPTTPPLYADSAPCVRRRPPTALLVARPRTRSSIGNKPLLEPLILDTKYFLVKLLHN